MITLIIKSDDAFGETYIQELPAEKIMENDSIIYRYEDDLGKTTVSIHRDFAEISREGEVNSKQIFKLGEPTDLFYSTPYFKSNFTIFTTSMEYIENELRLSYKIFEGQDEVNSLNITIAEK